MTTLPSETWLRIFEETHDNEYWPRVDRRPSPPSLLSISLVCSAWRALADRLRNRKIRLFISLPTHYQPFRSTPQKVEERFRPQRFVQHLSLAINTNEPDPESENEIMNNLRRMTNLKCLDLGWDLEWSPVTGAKHAIMQYISGMPIKELYLRGGWTNLMMTQYLCNGSTGMFSSLKTLDIEDAYPLNPEQKLPAALAYTSNVENIVIRGQCYQIPSRDY